MGHGWSKNAGAKKLYVFGKDNSLIKEVSSFQRLALGKEKVFLIIDMPLFQGCFNYISMG